jgi:hypothetical protein
MSYKKDINKYSERSGIEIYLPYRKINCTCREKYDFNGCSAECFAQLENRLITALLGAFSDTDKYLTRLLYR